MGIQSFNKFVYYIFLRKACSPGNPAPGGNPGLKGS
jgi:hypothetical protein